MSKELKHTKGPWEAKLVNNYASKYWFSIGSDMGKIVCNTPDNLNDSEANAKLIASAPQLLEALIRCVEDLENQTTQGEKERTIFIAKQAINKATS